VGDVAAIAILMEQISRVSDCYASHKAEANGIKGKLIG
jgi:hypothetical protein